MTPKHKSVTVSTLNLHLAIICDLTIYKREKCLIRKVINLSTRREDQVELWYSIMA